MFTKLTGRTRMTAGLALLLVSARAPAAEEFSRTVSANPKGQVEVSMVSGLVDISGWGESQIDVKGDISNGVERVDISSDGGRTLIKVIVKRQDHGGGRNGSANLRIRIPKNSDLEVGAISADVRTHGVLGEQRLKSVSGDVYAELAAADVETKTVSGNVSLRGGGKPISVRASSVSGDINYERGAGDLEGSTVSGSLSASLEPGGDIRVRTTSGDVTIQGKLKADSSVDGETISGELRLAAKTERGYRYEVSSFSGDIDNCFGKEAERTSRYGPGNRLLGSTGDGKGEVRLKTMSGDINICDR